MNSSGNDEFDLQFWEVIADQVNRDHASSHSGNPRERRCSPGQASPTWWPTGDSMVYLYVGLPFSPHLLNYVISIIRLVYKVWNLNILDIHGEIKFSHFSYTFVILTHTPLSLPRQLLICFLSLCLHCLEFSHRTLRPRIDCAAYTHTVCIFTVFL